MLHMEAVLYRLLSARAKTSGSIEPLLCFFFLNRYIASKISFIHLTTKSYLTMEVVCIFDP